MYSQLTDAANRNVVTFSGDPELSRHLDKVKCAVESFFDPETVKKYGSVVKPVYESAAPHEKRRLGKMTIRQAFAVIARQARAKVNGVGNFPGGRVPSSARSTRSRSIRRTANRARDPDDPLGSEPPLGVAARAEVQRILDAEARRILATRLEGDAIAPTPGSNEGALEDGLDDPAPAFDAQAFPIGGSVKNDGGSVDAL
jgi:hypothetical protein